VCEVGKYKPPQVPEFSAKPPPHQNRHFYDFNLAYENNSTVRNIDRIPEVVADLESQEVPNVTATARKHCVAQKTLEDR
jgi:hypothetical protein